MSLRVGTVTNGQAPRVDVTPDLRKILGDGIELVESGALDGLSHERIAAMAPREGDYVLVTRLADGTSVTICEREVTPLVKQKIASHFDNGIHAVLLLCTGQFPAFSCGGLLLEPRRVLFKMVEAVLPATARLGILSPSPVQTSRAAERWSAVTPNVKAVAASPYVNPEESIALAAQELAKWGADAVVMDCIGYSLAMKEQMRSVLDKPIIVARSVAARMLAELV